MADSIFYGRQILSPGASTERFGPGPKFWAQGHFGPNIVLTQYGYADSRRPSISFLEAGLAEAGLVEAGLVEPVFPGALARLQIGNS